MEKSDLLLFPDPSTLAVLPWRPSNGKVMRMYCDIKYPDGTSYEADTRSFLKKAVSDAKDMGIVCNFGPEFEFYLFNTDERGEPLPEPYDRAGYFDIAPADKGENFRREVCLTLEKMGIRPETSHHEEGPGQNEIDFKYGDALSAADNAVTFKWVVKTAAASNGLYADFSPKPFSAEAGSGMHINVSVHTLRNDKDPTREFMAGIMEHIPDITRFSTRFPPPTTGLVLVKRRNMYPGRSKTVLSSLEFLPHPVNIGVLNCVLPIAKRIRTSPLRSSYMPDLTV